jgi:hypothetical protein
MTSSLKSQALNLYNSAGVKKFQTLVSSTGVSVVAKDAPLSLNSQSIDLVSGAQSIIDLVSFLKALETTANTNTTAISDAVSMINNSDANISTLTTGLDALTSSTASNLSSAVATLNSTIDGNKTDINNQVIALTNYTTSEFSMRDTTLVDLQNQISGINTLVNTDPALTTQIQNVIALVNSADASLVSQLTDVLARVVNLEGRFDTLAEPVLLE